MNKEKIDKILKGLSITFLGLIIARFISNSNYPFTYILYVSMIVTGMVISTIYLYFFRKGEQFNTLIILIIIVLGLGLIFKDDFYISIPLVYLLICYIIRLFTNERKQKKDVLRFVLTITVLLSSFSYIQNIGSKWWIILSEYLMYFGIFGLIGFYMFYEKNITEQAKNRNIKKGISITLIGVLFLLTGISYTLVLQDYIIDYKKNRLINLAKKDYYDNKVNLQKILTIAEKIDFVNEIEILNNNITVIDIQDTISENNNYSFQSIYSDDEYPIIDVDFLDSCQVSVKYIDTTILYQSKWSLRISNENEMVYNKLVNDYLNTDTKTIDEITTLLNDINSIAISKNRLGLTIRYWGRYGENIEYYFTNKELDEKREYTYYSSKLEDNAYLIYEDRSLVDFIGSYYFYRFDI